GSVPAENSRDGSPGGIAFKLDRLAARQSLNTRGVNQRSRSIRCPEEAGTCASTDLEGRMASGGHFSVRSDCMASRVFHPRDDWNFISSGKSIGGEQTELGPCEFVRGRRNYRPRHLRREAPLGICASAVFHNKSNQRCSARAA